jgi:DNA-binding response OmpR family regulator
MNAGAILIVEDEQSIADLLEYALQQHGFRTATAHDGDLARRLFHERAPDLVLLDLNLPGIQGLDLFALMRRERPGVPIVMVTCRTEEADRVAGLELGADDYVTKPFSPREVVARVRAVLRRTNGPPPGGPEVVRVGPLELRPQEHRCLYGDEEAPLTRQEFNVLLALARHPARVFSRETIIERLYNGDGTATDRSVDAQIKRIRAKLMDRGPRLDPIRTVYGVGYKLNPALEDAP